MYLIPDYSGFPEEIKNRRTENLIRIKPDFAWSSILYPYPGTELGDMAINHGFFDANFEKVNISNKSSSVMNLGDKKINRKTNNLHHLMGVIVQFPFLRPFTNFLISLPLSYLYLWIYFALYGYKFLRQSSFKGILKTFGHYLIFYFKYVSRLEKKIKIKNVLEKKENTNSIPKNASISTTRDGFY